jgi:hypothetical protein
VNRLKAIALCTALTFDVATANARFDVLEVELFVIVG